MQGPQLLVLFLNQLSIIRTKQSQNNSKFNSKQRQNNQSQSFSRSFPANKQLTAIQQTYRQIKRGECKNGDNEAAYKLIIKLTKTKQQIINIQITELQQRTKIKRNWKYIIKVHS
ncbi:hypothetical protein TTHERM_01405880 (macronuclear) [Tetrahymena thermophila SB210]|uniref:Uncharacterized protein n=1 Tax=Tetrahymena thermophila (strain SB210) TaxID=312017 RepID=Q22SN8_TETTS|nr:hypothetical protein TTHERM_01405880 [Tetrahymena thermophila SB210]EAR88297.1 hypothetical protein TTHERM_01405880 [Tetrahymena thermophila SB210]|eukprot:XP_001008542.1 hypothetical protein TTHERM_01405880 [Tetrahymena thermophila SB210]